jgi:hypothetical protein
MLPTPCRSQRRSADSGRHCSIPQHARAMYRESAMNGPLSSAASKMAAPRWSGVFSARSHGAMRHPQTPVRGPLENTVLGYLDSAAEPIATGWFQRWRWAESVSIHAVSPRWPSASVTRTKDHAQSLYTVHSYHVLMMWCLRSIYNTTIKATRPTTAPRQARRGERSRRHCSSG